MTEIRTPRGELHAYLTERHGADVADVLTAPETPPRTRNTVTTWADGYGRWHARVSFPDSGYGNAGELALDRHWDSIRAAARIAIRRQIAQREQKTGETFAHALGRISIRIELEKLDSYGDGVAYGATFRERMTPTDHAAAAAN